MTLFTYSVIFHPSPVSKVANNADEWCPRVQLKTNLLVMEGGDEVLSAEKLNLQRKKERKRMTLFTQIVKQKARSLITFFAKNLSTNICPSLYIRKVVAMKINCKLFLHYNAST